MLQIDQSRGQPGTTYLLSTTSWFLAACDTLSWYLYVAVKRLCEAGRTINHKRAAVGTAASSGPGREPGFESACKFPAQTAPLTPGSCFQLKGAGCSPRTPCNSRQTLTNSVLHPKLWTWSLSASQSCPPRLSAGPISIFHLFIHIC